jgi:hypothetical protein
MSRVWKEAREVQQHQFITEFIAAYIQGLYKGDTVNPTGLTVNQGCSQVSTGLPRALTSAGRRSGQISEAATTDGAGTTAVETGMEPPFQGAQKSGP